MKYDIIAIEITKEDISRRKRDDISENPAANALNRLHPLQDKKWQVGNSIIYTRDNSTGNYSTFKMTPPALRKLLKSFNAGEEVNPGIYSIEEDAPIITEALVPYNSLHSKGNSLMVGRLKNLKTSINTKAP